MVRPWGEAPLPEALDRLLIQTLPKSVNYFDIRRNAIHPDNRRKNDVALDLRV